MILCYLETVGATLPKCALASIDAGLKWRAGQQGSLQIVGFVLGGEGAEAAAREAASYGLDKVYWVSASALEPYLALPTSRALISVAQKLGATAVVAAATSRGKDFMPRVAAALGAGLASDVIAFNGDGTFRRPMYAGNIIADTEITTPIKLVTIRQSAFGVPARSATPCSVERFELSVESDPSQSFVSFNTVKSERPELGDAEIVVSGGRALKSAENFQNVLLPLADQLGAAVGASRAAVDSGYAPNDWQVGQTGKVVAPKLYIAVGISGAIQHLAGMKDSKVIVAINQDPEAPIFEVADYGLVGDLFALIPQLTAELAKRKSG